MSNEHFYEKHDEGSLKNSAEAEAGSNKATVTKPATVAVEDVQAQNLRCAQRLSLKGKVFLGGCAAALVCCWRWQLLRSCRGSRRLFWLMASRWRR